MSDSVKPKAKGKKKAAAKAPPADGVAVATHPRAARHVRLAKGYAGLCGFGLGLFLSTKAGAPTALALERALLAGVLAYLVGWAVAVIVWRQVLQAELRAAEDRRAAARAEALAAATEPVEVARAR